MALPDLMDLVTHDPRKLACLRAVAGEAGGAMPDVEQLWRKPVFTITEGGEPTKSGRLSLEDLIDSRRGIDIVDGGAGPQPIDLPFTSLVVLTAEALPGAQELGRFLGDRIRERFRDAIDPDLGVAVHVAQSQNAAAPVAVYLGHGVSAPPEGGRAPQGEIVFRQAAGGDSMGSPLIGAGIAAGLHAGQRRLAFSRSETLTAAVHPDLPAGTIFMLGRFPSDAGQRSGSALPPLVALPQTAEARSRAIRTEPLPVTAAEAIDARYEVLGIRPQQGEVPLGVIEVTLDRRPLRLLHQPPQGPHLAVIGLAMPDRFGGRRIARWWVERTGQGRLLSSSFLASRDSLVVQGREIRRYDRRELRYARMDRGEAHVGQLDFDGRKRVMLMLDEGEFGFVAMPRQQVPVSFGPDQSARGFGACDWIGEAVRVQFAAGEVERLDGLYDGAPAGFLAPDASGVALQSAGDLWILGERQAQAAASTLVKPNTPFVAGPLVLELRGA